MVNTTLLRIILFDTKLINFNGIKKQIKLFRDELDMYSKDSACLAQMRKEVLKLERELMQEKNKNKLLQEELENPLNVHR